MILAFNNYIYKLQSTNLSNVLNKFELTGVYSINAALASTHFAVNDSIATFSNCSSNSKKN